MQKKINK